MVRKNITVGENFEAASAAMLVQTASKFASSIKLEVQNKLVNAKSIMGIISIGSLDGLDVTITAEGADENEAAEALAEFLK